jgi:hypothetical protein
MPKSHNNMGQFIKFADCGGYPKYRFKPRRAAKIIHIKLRTIIQVKKVN